MTPPAPPAPGADLDCKDLVLLVTAYLERALPEDEHARFEGHIALCPACGAYLAQMRTTLALLGRLGEEHVRPGAARALLAAFRGWRAAPRGGLTASGLACSPGGA